MEAFYESVTEVTFYVSFPEMESPTQNLGLSS